MQLNQNMLNRLLSMNDDQLSLFIRRIADEAGLELSQIGLDASNIQTLRQALGSTTEADLGRYQQLYDEYLNSKKRK